MKHCEKNNGFTLIELLVVVLIIGILSAIALPQYQLSVEKARAAEALTNIRTLYSAQQVYYLANGVYSNDINELDVEMPGSASISTTIPRKQTKWFSYAAKDGSGALVETSVANRRPTESVYALVVRNGVLKCLGYSDLGKKVCRNLGVKQTNTGDIEVWEIGSL